MNRILLVEDDEKIASLLKRGLENEGFGIDHFSTIGEVTASLSRISSYTLIILDLMLPDGDGLELLKTLRESGVMTPTIILSAKSSVDDRILGLKSGGDDYLVKPFALAELLARIEVIFRRNVSSGKISVITHKDLSLDLLKRTAFREGNAIELHPKEFHLLELFMRNPGKVFSKKMIHESVYGPSLKAQSNLVDVLVFRLRHKIDKPFASKYIQTVHGLGYEFESY